MRAQDRRRDRGGRLTVDEETLRYAAILRDKQQELRILEEQASKFGEMYVPPHIKMRIGSLQDELSMLETAIRSPARAIVSEELGAAGRFAVNHQQNVDIEEQGREIKESVKESQAQIQRVQRGIQESKQSIATVLAKLDTFVGQSEEWRKQNREWQSMHRQLIVIIGFTVIAILIAVAILGTVLVMRGAL